MQKMSDGRLRINYRSNGKRKVLYLPRGTSREDAKRIEAKLRLEMIDPQAYSECPTLEQFIPQFVAEYEAVHNSPSTAKRFEYEAKNHLIPQMGDLRLCDIKPAHILKLQADLNSRGFKGQTIGNTLSAASKVFKYAVTQGFMDSNPTSCVKRIEDKTSGTPPFWSFAERDQFLLQAKEANFEVYQLVAFAVTTGLRPGELWGLKRDCLDFHTNVVTVRRNWCTKTGSLNEYTKNRVERRVTVPPQVMALLASKIGMSPDRYVFSETITFLNFSYRVLKPMALAASVPQIKFHDLRHSYASHCVLKGLHQVEIRDLLGHKKLSTTDKYMHLKDDDKLGITNSLVEGMPWAVDHTPKVVALKFR